MPPRRAFYCLICRPAAEGGQLALPETLSSLLFLLQSLSDPIRSQPKSSNTTEAWLGEVTQVTQEGSFL